MTKFDEECVRDTRELLARGRGSLRDEVLLRLLDAARVENARLHVAMDDMISQAVGAGMECSNIKARCLSGGKP